MYRITILSTLFIGTIIGCSAEPNPDYGQTQEPVSATTGDTTTEPGETGGEVTGCVDVECPPPPVDWCNTDHSNTVLPAWLVDHWNLSCTELPSDCGDGILNDEEVCDDGNTVDGDGCAANCSAVE